MTLNAGRDQRLKFSSNHIVGIGIRHIHSADDGSRHRHSTDDGSRHRHSTDDGMPRIGIVRTTVAGIGVVRTTVTGIGIVRTSSRHRHSTDDGSRHRHSTDDSIRHRHSTDDSIRHSTPSTESCSAFVGDQCNETGVAHKSEAPIIIPSVRSFFMIFPLPLYSSSRDARFFATATVQRTELEAQCANGRSWQWVASGQQRLSYR